MWGYFRDGDALCKRWLLLVHYLLTELGKTASEAYDPNSRLDENAEPTGVSVYPKEFAEPDTNRLAVNDPEKR